MMMRSGVERAVPDRRHLVVQRRHRGHELSDETQRGVDFERQQVLLGDGQNRRERAHRHAVRDDHELGAVLAKSLHAANAREAGVLEADERVDAFTERRLERAAPR